MSVPPTPPDEADESDGELTKPGVWENRLWLIVPAIYLVAIAIYATVVIVRM